MLGIKHGLDNDQKAKAGQPQKAHCQSGNYIKSDVESQRISQKIYNQQGNPSKYSIIQYFEQYSYNHPLSCLHHIFTRCSCQKIFVQPTLRNI